mmetsp:Transcript_74875/g.216453  ORF Transcript_74875/g.216453 Transcript_74875/m.216453 type:complete len:202 (+) Transcript_74875:1881-2486(+)
MCCVVFERDRTTTGTPSSMLRRILRQRSRKFVKLLTQPTNAACLPIVSFPARSSANRASFNWRSTNKACTLSSISVMPSCLWKSIAWFATSSDAKGPRKRASSISRTVERWSTCAMRNDLACSITRSTLLAAARTCRPFSFPKASVVVATRSPSARRASPSNKVSTGASYQERGSKASMRLTVSARRASVSMLGPALMKLW